MEEDSKDSQNYSCQTVITDHYYLAGKQIINPSNFFEKTELLVQESIPHRFHLLEISSQMGLLGSFSVSQLNFVLDLVGCARPKL